METPMPDDHGGIINTSAPEASADATANRSANKHDIHVLNSLLAATADSADRLERVTQESESEGHRNLFSGLADERRDMARSLETAIVGLGGHPDAGGSILAKAQRAVMDARHALLGDEAGLAHAADDGEAALDRKYEAALADPKLAATTREVIRRVHARLNVEREEVHDLRRSLDSRRDADSPLFPN